ncbi:MAG: hypothetical protein ACRENZ_01960, partial [Thermodesulfobacteriota bacterium]
DGEIAAVDISSKAVFDVDIPTGDRTILSGVNIGNGPQFQSPRGISVEADGDILIFDNGIPGLFSVDPATGERTILAEFP